jgi:hypothetical protein
MLFATSSQQSEGRSLQVVVLIQKDSLLVPPKNGSDSDRIRA